LREIDACPPEAVEKRHILRRNGAEQAFLGQYDGRTTGEPCPIFFGRVTADGAAFFFDHTLNDGPMASMAADIRNS
jgi:hypothetical protein